MNCQRSIPTLAATRRRIKALLALAAVTVALASVTNAAAGPGGPKDGKGPPSGAMKGGFREQFGGGKPDAKSGPDGKKHGPAQGTAGASGFEGHHRGLPPEAMKKHLEELTQKETQGTLTDDEKKELARMKQFQQRRQTREERKARLAELKEKETGGKLSAEEKTELEKIQQVQARHDDLEKKAKERADTRKQRGREAKRQALKESPKVASDAATMAEYKKHAERLAKLERAKELATADQNTDAVAKIDKLIAQETQRHQAWLAKQQAGVKGPSQGANP